MIDKGLIIFTFAYLLDLAAGDPHNFYHPVRMIGLLIERVENVFYNFNNKVLGGLFLVIIVLFITFISIYSVISLSVFVECFLIYTLFATKSLGLAGMKIFRLLKDNKITQAKKELSFIVSRNTENMKENDIIRSTIESISENITDAVTAPMIYLFAGGLPLAMIYKAVSTMDSMVGYKNDRYIKFGKIAAKLDDFFAFIPARITGFFLIPMVSLFTGNNFFRSFTTVVKYRKFHDSPNAAYSEAAVAGALGIRLGGTNVYFGKTINKPFIGDIDKEPEIQDIRKTVIIMYLTSILLLIMLVLFRIIIRRVF